MQLPELIEQRDYMEKKNSQDALPGESLPRKGVSVSQTDKAITDKYNKQKHIACTLPFVFAYLKGKRKIKETSVKKKSSVNILKETFWIFFKE